MKIVDARGVLCPKPLILTKRAIKEGIKEFQVLLDNETAKDNVSSFLKENGMDFVAGFSDGVYTLQVSGAGMPLIQPDAASFCRPVQPSKPNSNYVIVLGSDSMGDGPEALGKILMQGFCNTIRELSLLPDKIIFYGKGVLLIQRDSPVLESLKELEEKGVKLMVCGTCLDYFNIKDSMGAGDIANMYDIVESFQQAGHIIRP